MSVSASWSPSSALSTVVMTSQASTLELTATGSLSVFSGLINHQGRLAKFDSDRRRLEVRAEKEFLTKLRLGGSVAVQGVCLTLVEKTSVGLMKFDLLEATLKSSNLAVLPQGARLNLETALAYGDPIGGHPISGHVVETLRVRDVRRLNNSWEVLIELSAVQARSLTEKGSVALDGVSLTVQKLTRESLVVEIVPHTYKSTSICEWQAGHRVNFEPPGLV